MRGAFGGDTRLSWLNMIVVLLSLLHPAALLKTSRRSDASSLTLLAAISTWTDGEERSKAQERYRGLSSILWHLNTVLLSRRTTNGMTIAGE